MPIKAIRLLVEEPMLAASDRYKAGELEMCTCET